MKILDIIKHNKNIDSEKSKQLSSFIDQAHELSTDRCRHQLNIKTLNFQRQNP